MRFQPIFAVLALLNTAALSHPVASFESIPFSEMANPLPFEFQSTVATICKSSCSIPNRARVPVLRATQLAQAVAMRYASTLSPRGEETLCKVMASGLWDEPNKARQTLNLDACSGKCSILPGYIPDFNCKLLSNQLLKIIDICQDSYLKTVRYACLPRTHIQICVCTEHAC